MELRCKDDDMEGRYESYIPGFLPNRGEGIPEDMLLMPASYYSSMARNYLKQYSGPDGCVIEALFSLLYSSMNHVNSFYIKYLCDMDIFSKELSYIDLQTFLTRCEDIISSIFQLSRLGIALYSSDIIDSSSLFLNTRIYGVSKKYSNYDVFMNLRAVFGEHLSNIRLDKKDNDLRYVVSEIAVSDTGLCESGYESVIKGCKTVYDLMYYSYAYHNNLSYFELMGDTPHGLALLIGRGDKAELIKLNIYDIYEFMFVFIDNVVFNVDSIKER